MYDFPPAGAASPALQGDVVFPFFVGRGLDPAAGFFRLYPCAGGMPRFWVGCNRLVCITESLVGTAAPASANLMYFCFYWQLSLRFYFTICQLIRESGYPRLLLLQKFIKIFSIFYLISHLHSSVPF